MIHPVRFLFILSLHDLGQLEILIDNMNALYDTHGFDVGFCRFETHSNKYIKVQYLYLCRFSVGLILASRMICASGVYF
jgi:hypothetical protein